MYAKNMDIAYLGPAASYSHEASLKIFEQINNFNPLKSIGTVFASVDSEKADYGVVPVENSSEGSVSVSLDCLAKHELKIVRETTINVNHSLLSNNPPEEIEVLYSHPQALRQCSNWIRKNMPFVELVEVSSTARAAEIASQLNCSAAIASEKAGQIFKLNVLATRIQDMANNQTRFVAISKTEENHRESNKTSLIITTEHNPGKLISALMPFKEHGVNMLHLESRPLKQRPWEYMFFVDVEGNIKDSKLSKVLKEIEKKSTSLKVLGSYQAVI